MNEDFETEKLKLCKFLKEKFDYDAHVTSSSVNCDVRIPDKKIRIQIVISQPEDRELILFLGTKQKQEIKWRLIRSHYCIIIDPSHYYILPSKALKELIEINGWPWKKEYCIFSRKNPKAVLIKIPKSFIIYGLLVTNNIQIFNKTGKQESLLNKGRRRLTSNKLIT